MSKAPINTLDELNNFCKIYDYKMELEIPFQEMEGFILSVTSSGDYIMSIPFVGINNINKAASNLLGKLAKEH